MQTGVRAKEQLTFTTASFLLVVVAVVVVVGVDVEDLEPGEETLSPSTFFGQHLTMPSPPPTHMLFLRRLTMRFLVSFLFSP